jgi:hypothetical protein
VSHTLLTPRNGRWYDAVESARIDALLGASFYLLRNDASGTGERYRCKRCRTKHTHFTRLCIELPFTAAQVRRMYLSARITRLEPGTRSPLAGFGVADLAAQHPRTERDLGAREKGDHWIAFLLGTAEPLTPRRAQELADRIRGAGAVDFTLQPLAAVAAAQPYLQEVQSHV